MKNLKNSFKILLLLPFIAMVSCINTDEDYSDLRTNGTTSQKNTVFIETDDTTIDCKSVPTSVTTSITVGINEALSSDTTVSFTVMKDGAMAVLGTDYNTTDATIMADDLFGTGDVTFLMPGLYEVMVGSSSSASLDVVPNKQQYGVSGAVSADVTATLTWVGGNDIDLYFFNMSDDWSSVDYNEDTSLGFSNTEITYATVYSGDKYALRVREWFGSGTQDFTLVLTDDLSGDTLYTFNGTVDSGASGTPTLSQIYLWFEIVPGDFCAGTDAVYTFYETDPQ